MPCKDSSNSATTDVAYERIAGYLPRSLVTDHNAIDLDQAAMEVQLALKTATGFTNGKNIYTQGGNSKSYAEFTVPALASGVAAGTLVKAMGVGGFLVTGTVKSAAAAGATTLQVLYAVSNTQSTYVQCRVGGMASSSQMTTGCFHATRKVRSRGAGWARHHARGWSWIATAHGGVVNPKRLAAFVRISHNG